MVAPTAEEDHYGDHINPEEAPATPIHLTFQVVGPGPRFASES